MDAEVEVGCLLFRLLACCGLVWSGLVGQGPVQLQASGGEAASARQANGLDEAPIAVD